MKSLPITSINLRLRYLSFCLIVVAGTIGARLFFLQVLHHGEYLSRAYSQQQSFAIKEVDRGSIYFREHKTGALVTAASTQKGYLLYIDNRYVKNTEEIYKAVNSITPIDSELFHKIIQKENDPYEILKARITREEGEKISQLKLPGVGLLSKSWRWYPGDTLASHLLGFVSFLGDSPTGQYGAEKYYETYFK